jgi:hypothetical protein
MSNNFLVTEAFDEFVNELLCWLDNMPIFGPAPFEEEIQGLTGKKLPSLKSYESAI